MKQVIVTIDADAEVKVEAKGTKGAGCAALTRAIEQALGTTTGDVKKPEFYQTEAASERAKAGH